MLHLPIRFDKPLTTINLPLELRGRQGIAAVPVSLTSAENAFSGTVLCLQDNPQNTTDLEAIADLQLQVKVGGVDTACGMIVFLLFVLWDEARADDKFIYEVLLDPTDPASYEQYAILDDQEEWKLLVVEGSQVVKMCQFKNVYHMTIRKVAEYAAQSPCLDFDKAKEEYFRDYTISGLMRG